MFFFHIIFYCTFPSSFPPLSFLSLSLLVLFCFFEKGSCYITQPCSKFGILLSSVSEPWDYRYTISSGWFYFFIAKYAFLSEFGQWYYTKASLWDHWKHPPALSCSQIVKESKQYIFRLWTFSCPPHPYLCYSYNLVSPPWSHLCSTHTVNTTNSELTSNF